MNECNQNHMDKNTAYCLMAMSLSIGIILGMHIYLLLEITKNV